MIPVSSDFRTQMLTNTKFRERADITLANGRVLNLTERDFSLQNNSVSEGAGISGFPLGIATCRVIQIELLNDNDQLSDYDFFGARIHLRLSYDIISTHSTEVIDYGYYTVIEPATYGATILITALDDMRKADKPYDTDLIYPASAGEILQDACSKCGINQGDVTFTNHSYIVENKPTDVTYRQIIGFVAMLAGGNARIDMMGYLRIKTYGLESIVENSLDGGGFPHIEVDSADGGNFTDYSSGDNYDGGQFGDARYVVLNSWKTLKIETDDVIITGVKDKETGYQYGNNGYVLEVDNKLITGDEENAIQMIGAQIIGQRLRPFEGDCVANPIVEFMDYVMLTDRKGNTYPSVVTDLSFTFFGFTTIKNSSTSANKASSTYTSEATKVYAETKKLVEEEKTDREQAVAQLAQEMANSSGLYMTTQIQQDLSTIYYMHDKPTLAQSQVIWRLSANAFAISTDGGQTYPYGLDSSGQAILRKIYAEGIDADYINAGHMSADHIRGGDLILGGQNNINGKIRIYNANNEETATISKDGIEYYGNWYTYNNIPCRNKVSISEDEIVFTSPVNESGGVLEYGDTVFKASNGGLDVSTRYTLKFNSTMLGFFGNTVSTKGSLLRMQQGNDPTFFIQQIQNVLAGFGLVDLV